MNIKLLISFGLGSLFITIIDFFQTASFEFEGITFSTGGYSAQYGQALSSVVDLTTWNRFGDYNAHSIGIVLLWLAAFLTIYTGYDYVRKKIHHAIE